MARSKIDRMKTDSTIRIVFGEWFNHITFYGGGGFSNQPTLGMRIRNFFG